MKKVRRQDGFKKVRMRRYVESENEKVNGKLRRRLKKSKDKCYSCGERGHWARECPNSENSRLARIQQ